MTTFLCASSSAGSQASLRRNTHHTVRLGPRPPPFRAALLGAARPAPSARAASPACLVPGARALQSSWRCCVASCTSGNVPAPRPADFHPRLPSRRAAETQPTKMAPQLSGDLLRERVGQLLQFSGTYCFLLGATRASRSGVRPASPRSQASPLAHSSSLFDAPGGQKLDVPVTIKKSEKYPSGEITQGASHGPVFCLLRAGAIAGILDRAVRSVRRSTRAAAPGARGCSPRGWQGGLLLPLCCTRLGRLRSRCVTWADG
jgi:hypothetical protein|eukprot:COSAG06_NODE_140_length_22325_cov_187.593404_14_plen_260_part_00